MNQTVQELVDQFGEWLSNKKETLACFTRYGVQVEGWLKGEFLCFLDSSRHDGAVYSFDREVRAESGGRIDFTLKMTADSETTWLELKHWIIGSQKGYTYAPGFYFRDRSSAGIRPDVEKLDRIRTGKAFLLILTTKNPGKVEWNRGLDDFNKKFAPLAITTLTDPAAYPEEFYLGFLELNR